MGKEIIVVIVFLFLGNIGFCQKKKNFREVSYHNLSDSSIAVEVLAKRGVQKEYSYYRNKKETSTIKYNNRTDWEKLVVVQEPDCKLVYFPNQQDIFPHKSIVLHYELVDDKSQLDCKYVEDYRKSGTVLICKLKKWHPNGELAYKERSTTKRKYHYRRYNEEGRLTVKWSRDFTKGMNRLDGWATIWHEKDKRKLYKLYFEQDRVVHFIQYDHRDRVAIKADYSEEDKSMYDLLPKRRAELLYIEEDCKSICFPACRFII